MSSTEPNIIEICSNENQPILNQPAAVGSAAYSSNHLSVYLNEFGLPTNLTEILLNNENNNADPFKIMNDFTTHNNLNVNTNQIAGIIIQPNQELNNNNIYIVHSQANQDQQTGMIRISHQFENNPADIEIHPNNNYTQLDDNNAFTLIETPNLPKENNVRINSCVPSAVEKQIHLNDISCVIEQENECMQIRINNVDTLTESQQTDQFRPDEKSKQVQEVVYRQSFFNASPKN